MAAPVLLSTKRDQFDYPENKLWTVNSDNLTRHHEPPPAYVTVTTFGKAGKYAENEYSSPAHGTHGIGVWIAAVFILGEMAGGGVIAMPFAMYQAGWGGIAINILGAVVSAYTGFQLGWCWAILQETWPEYRQQTRKPYPEIGYRAGGRIMKYFCQFCVNFTVFGTAVAFLVLAAQNISSLILEWFGWNLNYCYMILVLAAFLWPFTMLGTPKDFWPMAVGAILATTLAVCLVIVGTGIDAPTCQKKVSYPAPTFVSFIQAYGTIAFAYGGHSAFPTIQHDMKRPSLFPKSVLYAYIIVFLLYFPMPMFSYAIYGGNVLSPVYLSISNDVLRDIITVLITGHVMFAFFIFMNPISQDLEDILKVPTNFTWKRVCTRTFMVIVVTFVALSVPDFGTLLNLIGGTTIAAMTFVCPGPFYMLLRRKTAGKSNVEVIVLENGQAAERPIPTKMSLFDHHSVYGPNIAWWEWIVNGIVVIVGVFGGAATIYGVIATWQNLSPPCYTVNMNGAVEGLNPNHTFCYNDNYIASDYLKQ